MTDTIEEKTGFVVNTHTNRYIRIGGQAYKEALRKGAIASKPVPPLVVQHVEKTVANINHLTPTEVDDLYQQLKVERLRNKLRRENKEPELPPKRPPGRPKGIPQKPENRPPKIPTLKEMVKAAADRGVPVKKLSIPIPHIPTTEKRGRGRPPKVRVVEPTTTTTEIDTDIPYDDDCF